MKRLGHSVISNSLNTYWLVVKGFRLFVITEREYFIINICFSPKTGETTPIVY